MKNLYTLYSILLVWGLIASSCNEEFLDTPGPAYLNENILGNKAGVEASLIATYAMLDGWDNRWENLSFPWASSGSNWIWGSVISDDAHKGSVMADKSEITELELLNWEADDPYLNTKFKALYEGISRANTTHKLLLEAEDISPEDEGRIEGEIRFLRAHYHFEAVKIWGKVPYFDQNDEEFRKDNELDILPILAAEFKKASELLPEQQAEKARASKGAALAYLGKVQLYQQDWSGAKSSLEKVVNSGRYSLNPCFHDIFSTDGENGAETIFSIQASVNDGTEGGENGNYGDRLNYPGGASPFGCCGFHQVSQNLVNAHKVDGRGLPLLDNFDLADLDARNDWVDPRLDWTVGRDGVAFLNWGIHQANWIRDRETFGPFSPKKFTHLQGEESQSGWGNKQLNPVNMPIIRYADVLLMLAEADVELGNLESARQGINQIRNRAGGCVQGPQGGPLSIDPDDEAISWAQYKVGTYDTPWADQAFARKAVQFERRIELALEGHRFFDLRRWGIAEEVMNNFFTSERAKRSYLQQASYFEDRHLLFPLPAEQIERSKEDGIAQLIQNSGW